MFQGGAQPRTAGTPASPSRLQLPGLKPGWQHVGLHDKPGHKGAGRPGNQLLGRGALLQAARREHGDAIAHRQGLLGIVGHQHGTGLALPQQAWQLPTQAQAHLAIEVRKGFIKE